MNILNKIYKRKNLLLVIDVLLIIGGYFLAYALTLTANQIIAYLPTFRTSFLMVAVVYITAFYLLKMYDQMWRYADATEYKLCAISTMVGGAGFVLFGELAGYNVPIRIQMASPFIILALVISSRIIYKLIIEKENKKNKYKNTDQKHNQPLTKKNIAIIGAGEAGHQLLRELKQNPHIALEPICFIDDNNQKIGRKIYGIPIQGPISDISNIVKNNQIEKLIIAIPTITPEDKKRIVKLASDTNCKVKILPDITNMLKSPSQENQDQELELLGKLRNLDLEDLLGREAIKVNDADIKNYIKNATVLVTGGGGSIGSELCRQAVKYEAKKLIILDNYENNAYQIQQELIRQYKFTPQVEIISVRDLPRLSQFFEDNQDIDVVFHAAAHKHVPLMEHNPEAAIKNNVFGTYNVANLCNKHKIKKMILISTDKAVNPTNVMGATKRLCEMVIQSMGSISKDTDYAAVRFGNVLGSNGSVIPLFKDQIEKGGPITVTHPDIIRYFMTIPEAVSLVLNAGAMAKGGEIFVLDMGDPVKIVDLAKNIISLSGLTLGKDINIVFTGLRPGEKLYEELLMAEEGLNITGSEKIFIGKSTFTDHAKLQNQLKELKSVVDGNADMNANASVKIDTNEIRNKLKEIVVTYKEVEWKNKEIL